MFERLISLVWYWMAFMNDIHSSWSHYMEMSECIQEIVVLFRKYNRTPRGISLCVLKLVLCYYSNHKHDRNLARLDSGLKVSTSCFINVFSFHYLTGRKPLATFKMEACYLQNCQYWARSNTAGSFVCQGQQSIWALLQNSWWVWISPIFPFTPL